MRMWSGSVAIVHCEATWVREGGGTRGGREGGREEGREPVEEVHVHVYTGRDASTCGQHKQEQGRVYVQGGVYVGTVWEERYRLGSPNCQHYPHTCSSTNTEVRRSGQWQH